MAFWGSSFQWNGVPSETYKLFITSPDGEGGTSNASNNVELLTQSIFRRPKPYLLGVSQSTVLTFPVEFHTPDELTAEDARLASKWLFGQTQYGTLSIMQSDLIDVVFRCFLLNPQTIRVGNAIRGFSADVTCDAPWGWSYPKSVTRTYAPTEPNKDRIDVYNETIVINNLSDNVDYLYPVIEARMGNYGGSLIVKNAQDNDRQMTFTGLEASELLTIDNDLKIITSSSGDRRMSNFNLNWMRLVWGVNNVSIGASGLKSIKFTYRFARKIGG